MPQTAPALALSLTASVTNGIQPREYDKTRDPLREDVEFCLDLVCRARSRSAVREICRFVRYAPVVATPAMPSSAGPADRPPGFAVIDVETSGLQTTRHRIVEIAVVRADQDGAVVDEWATLVNPGGPTGPSRVHGITAAMIRNAPTFADLIGELNHRLTGRTLVAHGATFDLDFLNHEYDRLGWTFPRNAPSLCTLRASLGYLPRLRRRRLRDCCRAAGFAMGRGHSALGDAHATARLLAFFLARAEQQPDIIGELTDPTKIAWPPIPVRTVSPVGRGRPSLRPRPHDRQQR